MNIKRAQEHKEVTGENTHRKRMYFLSTKETLLSIEEKTKKETTNMRVTCRVAAAKKIR